MDRQDYIELRQEWHRIQPSLLPNLFGPEHDIVKAIDDCYKAALEATQQRFMRKRANKLKPLTCQHQFDAEVGPVLFAAIKEDLRALIARQRAVENELVAAEDVDCTPLDHVWHVVQSSSTRDFGSQTNPNFYARGVLREAEDALQRAGIPFQVQSIKEHDSKPDGCGYWHDPVYTFRLWAPIEPELLTYVRVNFGRDSLEVNREHLLNNAVLHPFDQRTPFEDSPACAYCGAPVRCTQKYCDEVCREWGEKQGASQGAV